MIHERSQSVGTVVLNPRDEVLLLFRTDHRNWEFPRGKRQRGEGDEETLQRELGEEAGIDGYELLPGFREEVRFSFPFQGKMIDREVTYYLVRTSQQARISKEHSEMRWVSLHDAEGMVKFDNYKRVLKHVEAYLTATGVVNGA